jgi:hypothetical protein
MKLRGRIVLDILVVSILLMVTIAGCVNNKEEFAETESVPASMVSDASETEAATTTTSETTKNTMPSASVDPTYEEAAAYVRELLEAGNSADEVIAILMSEGRTEFDATALVNSVLMEGGTGESNSSSGSNSGNSNSGKVTTTTETAGPQTNTVTGTTAQETTSATNQTTTSQPVTQTTPTSTSATSSATPETTPVPTKVKQTVYMRIVWSDSAIETMAAQGVDLNAERPEAIGIDIYACDENGNFNAGTIIDSSGGDAAELQLYTEADAILAKYNLVGESYSYTAYKFENEYIYE